MSPTRKKKKNGDNKYVLDNSSCWLLDGGASSEGLVHGLFGQVGVLLERHDCCWLIVLSMIE